MQIGEGMKFQRWIDHSYIFQVKGKFWKSPFNKKLKFSENIRTAGFIETFFAKPVCYIPFSYGLYRQRNQYFLYIFRCKIQNNLTSRPFVTCILNANLNPSNWYSYLSIYIYNTWGKLEFWCDSVIFVLLNAICILPGLLNLK